ncbi:3-hydroxyacyl-CoA dehydrogenase [Oricola sp.]|uniref:3-hydroxyacyl-CoA dehydrogenase n=1 Tax=Oricola sp. TaxID=1979950 RepID=UPI0025CFE4E9|nr:3-hydroxyacyl-CoA dehydrogenase [Oricola sp.]MCI5078127.1 3-hydroxyacyl-CoA dehydrogenase [Oricola sp.]
MSTTDHAASSGVAIVGAGLVGLGWAIVFARAGIEVRVFDRSKDLVASLPAKLEQSLSDLESFGLIERPQEIAARVSCCETLAEAVRGIGYVQESVLERVDVKRALYEELDGLLDENTIVGSSSSGIPSSDFTEGLSIAPRCLVAHPVNPPYLVPVVELVPASWTLPEAVDQVHDLMHAVGQHPVRVARELRGFVLNRLQGVLLREAWALFEEGYCSAADIDATISKGLGLRWAFMGPFETIDLNAPGGVRDYANRLGGLYLDIASERGEPQPWSDELIGRVEAERRDALPLDGLQDRTEWRDRRLMALAAHMRSMEAAE